MPALGGQTNSVSIADYIKRKLTDQGYQPRSNSQNVADVIRGRQNSHAAALPVRAGLYGVASKAGGAFQNKPRDLYADLLAGGGGGGSRTTTSTRSGGGFQWAGPNDGDFDSYAQRVIAQLNPAYDAAVNAAGEQRGRATGEINTSHADALSAFGRTNADYQRQAAALDAQVGQFTDSAKLQALGDAAGVGSDLAAQGAAMGAANGSGDSGAGMAQVANFAAVDAGNVLDTQSALQRALGARMSEVQAQQQQDTRNSADQVKGAATGTLANNYSDILNRIQSDRAKAQASVIQEAERMKMDNKMAYANALNQYNSSNGTTTETTYGGGESVDPLDRLLKVAELQKMQSESGGRSGLLPDQAPVIANGYLADSDGNKDMALTSAYMDAQQGAITPEDFQLIYAALSGG